MADYLFLKEFDTPNPTFDDILENGYLYEQYVDYPNLGSRQCIMCAAPEIEYTFDNISRVPNTAPFKIGAYYQNGPSSDPRYIYLVCAMRVEDFNSTNLNCGVCRVQHNPAYGTPQIYRFDSFSPESIWTTPDNVKIRYVIYSRFLDTNSYVYGELPTIFNTKADCLNALCDYNWEYTDDPYNPDGTSKPGGSGGDFDNTSDPIDFPSLPTLSAVTTGFVNLYNPSLTQLIDLSSYLWGNLFDISQWKRIIADPMDAIIGLSIVPVSVPNSGPLEITVGNIPTGISANKASAQWVAVDCGSIEIKEHWGAYLDYAPYTKLQLYLPFIGIIDLDTDDVMNTTMHIKYNVDILTGCCVAFIKCNNHVLYSFNGQCAVNIPFTGNDWTNLFGNIMTLGATALSGKIGAGTAIASDALNNDNSDIGSSLISGVRGYRGNAQASASLVTSSKIGVKHSGSLGSSSGLMSKRKPYLIRTNPRQCLPSKQNTYTGYPGYIKTTLSDCKGFTVVEEMHLGNIHATDEELNEIENLLKSGVYL